MKLLITGAAQFVDEQLNAIQKLEHEVYFLQQESDTLPLPADEIEGVICNGLFLHHKIENFVNLKFIQLTSAGFDRVPMDYVNARDIKIFNARGVYSIPMAEFAVSGVLQLYKQARFFSQNQKNHKWEKHRGLLELYGKTVCIVGCGSVGDECAKRFTAFGCKILGIDLTPESNNNFEQIYTLDKLDEILPKADIIILSLPLTDKTRHIINAQRLALLADGAVIVNISRGAIIDTEALIPHLERLGGAVVDVFEEEPLPEAHPLWDKSNVIVTPHNSFVGEGNNQRLFKAIISNL